MIDIDNIRDTVEKASKGKWLWGGTICKTKDKAIKRIKQSIKRTINPTDKFYEVFLEDGRVLSITGNGPTSEYNAQFISTFSPENVTIMLDEIEKLYNIVDTANRIIDSNDSDTLNKIVYLFKQEEVYKK